MIPNPMQSKLGTVPTSARFDLRNEGGSRLINQQTNIRWNNQYSSNIEHADFINVIEAPQICKWDQQKILITRELSAMRLLLVKTDQIATDSPLMSNRLTGPIQFLNLLLKTWNIGPKEAACLLGFERSSRQHVEKLLNGTIRLQGRDVKDRIGYLFEIRSTLSALFMDEGAENQWIREPQPLLDDQVPLKLMLEGGMANLLLVLNCVDEIAGL